MNTILLLGAKSKNKPLESVPTELSQIKQLFSSRADANYKVEYEPYLTRSILGNLLRNLTDQVDIIHFAGHSSAEQLQTDDELVYSRHIAGVIKNWDHKPSLLFLNGCNNATQVKDFLEAGVLCVIATHNYIDDCEAARFAYEFYAYLLSNPKKVTLWKAFQSAGSTALMGKSHQARSFDIDTLKNITVEEWDWGLFCQPPDISNNWTLISSEYNLYKAKISNLEPKRKSVDLSKLGANKLLNFFLNK